MSCPRCPHCIGSGAFGFIDKDDPALTTNQPRPASPKMVEVCCAWKKCGRVHLVRVADFQRGWGRFCSKSCKAKAQSRDQRAVLGAPSAQDWTEGGER